MLYAVTITTPKDTLETDKKKTEVKMEQGLIKGFELYLPPGSAGLMHCHIDDATHQVWPKAPGDDFAGDNITIKWNDTYPLLYPPYQLQVYTWNLDDTFQHALRVSFWIEQIEGVRLTPEFLAAREAEEV